VRDGVDALEHGIAEERLALGVLHIEVFEVAIDM
jgi:hypothetical protein